VRRAVRAAAAECYRSANATGEITVRVEVGAGGSVFRSRVTNNGTGSQDVARCVSGALVGRRVDGSGGGTYDIDYSR
jgi:hypothetical protein